MKSSVFHFSLIAVALTAAVAVTSASGCTDAASAALNRADGENEPVGSNPSTEKRDDPSGVVAGGKTTSKLGSPLCEVTVKRCMPDDDGTRPVLDENIAACVDAPDASADAGSVLGRACRISEHGQGDTPRSVCLDESANPAGVDGAECQKGSDCAAGFDCVSGEMGSTCRRYCCMGSSVCNDHRAQNGGPTFCDIQTLLEAKQHRAPVCMPLKSCKLLAANECAEDETCAIVTDEGDTGCVAAGAAKEGETCDEDHCLKNLTCLGNPGDRRCYQLCRTNGSECVGSKKCTTGSVFQDKTFGVCKTPTQNSNP